jgi:hypothetical protein
MVYLDAYDPRARHLSAYDPRTRHLRGLAAYDARHRLTGLGIDYPRHRYLTGLGCASCRMLSALGQDIAPPDIGPSAPAPTPILITDISSPATIGPTSTGYTPPVGPTNPGGFYAGTGGIIPQQSATPLPPPPVAPAISYGAPGSPSAITAITGAVPQVVTAITGGRPMVTSPPGTVFGVPTQYLVYGGLGLLALTVLGTVGAGKRR